MWYEIIVLYILSFLISLHSTYSCMCVCVCVLLCECVRVGMQGCRLCYIYFIATKPHWCGYSSKIICENGFFSSMPKHMSCNQNWCSSVVGYHHSTAWFTAQTIRGTKLIYCFFGFCPLRDTNDYLTSSAMNTSPDDVVRLNMLLRPAVITWSTSTLLHV